MSKSDNSIGLLDRILIPVDFSEVSINALNYGIEIAKRTQSKLILLHAYRLLDPKISSRYHSESSLREELESKARKEFAKMEKKYLEGTELDYELVIEIGFIHTNILLLSQTQNIDLVIIGTKEDDRIGDVLGAVTLKVLQKVSCPVMVIPAKVKFQEIKNIVVAGEFKKVNNLTILDILTRISRIFNSKVHIIDFDDNGSSKYDKFKLFEAVDFLEPISISKSEPGIDEKIISYLKDHPIDLFSITPDTPSLFNKMYMQSHPKEFRPHSKIPFLAINNLAS